MRIISRMVKTIRDAKIDFSTAVSTAGSMLLFFAGGATVFFGVVAASELNTAAAASLLAVGLVLVLASGIERFDVLSAFGMVAKTRKLERTLQEADDTLNEMRILAELTGASIIRLTANVGRFDGAPSAVTAYEEAIKIRALLLKAGSDLELVRNLMRPLVKNLLFDLTLAMTAPLRDELRKEEQKTSRIATGKDLLLGDQDKLQERDTRSNALREYNERVGYFQDISSWRIEDYPARLMAIFDNVPLVDAALVSELRQKAYTYRDDIELLKQSFTLKNPDRWLAEIDSFRGKSE